MAILRFRRLSTMTIIIHSHGDDAIIELRMKGELELFYHQGQASIFSQVIPLLESSLKRDVLLSSIDENATVKAKRTLI